MRVRLDKPCERELPALDDKDGTHESDGEQTMPHKSASMSPSGKYSETGL